MIECSRKQLGELHITKAIQLFWGEGGEPVPRFGYRFKPIAAESCTGDARHVGDASRNDDRQPAAAHANVRRKVCLGSDLE
jgi:hypothetical protein